MLPAAVTADLNALIQALRQQPSVGGTIGLAGIGDDFFVAVRVIGGQVSILLSDLTAALDYSLARQVLAALDIPVPDDEDIDQVLPVGDLSIFADLGLDEMDLAAIASDLDLSPGRGAGQHRGQARLRTGHGTRTRHRARTLTASTGYAASFEPAMGSRSRRRRPPPSPAGRCPGRRGHPRRGSNVIARARNRREADHDPTAHAEILAMRAARPRGGSAADRADAGRDARAVHDVRGRDDRGPARRLVYGAEDPKAGAVGSIWDVVRDPRLSRCPRSSGVSWPTSA